MTNWCLRHLIIPSSFVIRHSSFSVDISRPDESSDQPVPGLFCFGGPAHGARDSDATPEERRPGRRIWGGRHGKHFRRANDQRACEVYHLAGRHFFRAHPWVVDFVCASGHRRGERVPACVNETAGFAGNFSRTSHGSAFTRFFSGEFANSGISCFFSGARGATNSDAVRLAFR